MFDFLWLDVMKMLIMDCQARSTSESSCILLLLIYIDIALQHAAGQYLPLAMFVSRVSHSVLLQTEVHLKHLRFTKNVYGLIPLTKTNKPKKNIKRLLARFHYMVPARFG